MIAILGINELKDGLYNIKDGKIYKYKDEGGTVRVYDMISISDIEYEAFRDFHKLLLNKIENDLIYGKGEKNVQTKIKYESQT